MKTNVKSRGTWIHRCAISFFTVVLGVLVYWLLGFLVVDIQCIQGPDYAAIEKKHLRPELVSKRTALERQIAEFTRQITNLCICP